MTSVRRASLGAIIAGGASRRFGSDKALARVGGVSLLDHVRAALAPQVDDLVLCGRASDQLRWITDRPQPGLGPLGGINAALADAQGRGFDAVVTVPVDIFPMPTDLVERLGGGGARVFVTQHLIGYWPISYGPHLDAHLAAGHRSLWSWIAATGARKIDDADLGMCNINTCGELGAIRLPHQQHRRLDRADHRRGRAADDQRA